MLFADRNPTYADRFVGTVAQVQFAAHESPVSPALFFVRHWGVLILAVAALILYSAYAPTLRAPVLVAAAFEKFAIGLLVFFGPVKRTGAMTAIATVDGVFAILYAAYLSGI